MIYHLALTLGYASPSRMLSEMRPTDFGLFAALINPRPPVPESEEAMGENLKAALMGHNSRMG